jgi:glycosyltransferase involved in cell wall biosynthesis
VKTLHIVQGIDGRGGGIVSAVISILTIEKSLGMESTVISIRADGLDPSFPKMATVNILKPSFPARFSRSKDANNWLRKNACNYNLAVIHGIWGALPIDAARILHDLQVPFIIWSHGSLDPFDLRKKKYVKKILGPIVVRAILDRSAAIVCTADMEAEKLEKYGAKTNTIVLPLPITPLPGQGDRQGFRRKFSLSNDDFVLLFLSRIDYIKGLNLLVPAIKKISINYPNIKLIIAGADWNGYEKKVRAWIRKYKLEDRVIMVGFLSGSDKRNAFAGSDCFVLPSMKENFGISVVEALSTGLPVLISNGVYIWEKIIQNGGGWACDYSTESIAESITHILKNPSELEDKRKNAKRSAEQYSPEKVGPLYKKFYLQLIK